MLDYEELLCFAKAENLEDKPFKEVIELYDKHMEEKWLDIFTYPAPLHYAGPVIYKVK